MKQFRGINFAMHADRKKNKKQRMQENYYCCIYLWKICVYETLKTYHFLFVKKYLKIFKCNLTIYFVSNQFFFLILRSESSLNN